MNKIDKFIDKHFNEIIDHYKQEGKDMGYEKKELNGYAYDTVCFTFVGTQTEIDKELGNKHYYVICEENGISAVETFSGETYNFIYF